MTLNTGNHFMVSCLYQLITACSIHSLEVVVVDEFRTSLADSIANDDFDRGTFFMNEADQMSTITSQGTGVVADAAMSTLLTIS